MTDLKRCLLKGLGLSRFFSGSLWPGQLPPAGKWRAFRRRA
jgi:hypothetical protein